jgi:hypothetical protein
MVGHISFIGLNINKTKLMSENFGIICMLVVLEGIQYPPPRLCRRTYLSRFEKYSFASALVDVPNPL